jgi:hypothetical protein
MKQDIQKLWESDQQQQEDQRCARGVVDVEQRKAQIDHNSGSRGNSSSSSSKEQQEKRKREAEHKQKGASSSASALRLNCR